MIFSLITPGLVGAESSGKLHHSVNDYKASATQDKVSNRLQDQFEKDDKVTFLIKFAEKADTTKVAKEARANAQKASLSAQKVELAQRSAVVSELKAVSIQSQQNVLELLESEAEKGNAQDIRSYFIVNGIAVTATKEIAEKVATFAEVEKILPNETRELHTTTITEDAETPQSELANVEWNVERVGAPAVWDMGIDGTGTVVASLDTGVQWDHPALQEKYRGYDAATGEVDHEFSWYDASGGQDAAYDDHGHGTHVTGTMVGSEPDGSNQVGVAPGAKWIATKVFDAAGYTSDAILLDAAEWIIAPGGRVDMAPDVVNNSWGGGPGLDEWYRDSVRAWRDAEIFPEFSAGNTTLTNPGGPGSVAVPANYPESFATGATDINDNLASFSLRGPSPYDEIKPDISAPGVNIRSSVPGSGYEGGWNGTSMSGPAVAAVAALLRQVNAEISVDDMEEILMNTATPLTDSEYPDSPNNGYGHGLVNAFDAVSSILDGLGTIEGQVTMDGEDTEAPTFEHEAPVETYEGMDLELTVDVSDNISVTSVELQFGDQTVEANRVSGDYRSGEYAVTVPGDAINGDSFTYQWVINDFGNNEVTSEEYVVEVNPGITVGYEQDFESNPVGWTSSGANNSWEWGEPTSGPGEAASGVNVYATNLAGQYDNNTDATLVMPPIDLPEGESFLQFNHWYNIENNWDYGYVQISTDQENWTELVELTNVSDGWEAAEFDLSDYSGERVYIAFNLDTDGSVLRDGWYIDDVALSDTSLGIDTAKEKAAQNKEALAEKKEKVNSAKAEPSLPKEDDSQAKENQYNPSALPLGAQVSVLETGRSVATNPQDGSYSLMHAAGSFTVVAEAYGFYSQEQSITLEADGTAEANFTLEELPQATVSGTVTSQKSGNPIEGATLLLVEDANITPVETDADGNYDLTAYEGTYTLKVMANDYHGQEVEITLDGDMDLDLELEPFFTVPGGEIGYDDGTAENARAYYDAGNKWAVKMSLPEGRDSAIVTDGVFQFHGTDWPVPGDTPFAVEVWSAGDDGMPDERLAGPIDAEAIRSLDEWTVVDLREQNIQVEGDFYMVYVQTGANPNVPGLATDENSPNAERSYQSVGGAWSQSPAAEGNYMIRARVAYGVDNPVITAPAEGLITNDASVTVEGTASPTTTVNLLNNGEEVGSAEIGDDGNFAIDVELTEGENEFTAVSIVNGEEATESESVTVTLDTEAPELTIENPSDGDKTNRETVTVEGLIADDHLDSVTVNGQEASVSDGTFSKRIILDEGENVIEVVATDLAGNVSTETVMISADYTAPEIDNLTPTEDQDLQTGETVMIEFDSEPGLRATFMVHMPLTNLGAQLYNATELPMMETSEGHYVGYWTVPSNLVADGAVIEVKVVDDFGNETRQLADGKLFINGDEENTNGNGKAKGKEKNKGNGKGKGKN
ncbi:S8 family serine peptidase [Ornithinibacillus salinisoli]|uniref:S8 family serine peptidase n=1 Tax=Ornithinibacillus salinisoli TaxID=1848459 RepID=A0ABW4W7A4_9BACI